MRISMRPSEKLCAVTQEHCQPVVAEESGVLSFLQSETDEHVVQVAGNVIR